MASTIRVSKKRKFVADGVMFAEINELLGKVRGCLVTWGVESTLVVCAQLQLYALPPTPPPPTTGADGRGLRRH